MFRLSPAFKAILGIVVLGALLAVYLLAIRPWFLHWGATTSELEKPLPGDELVAEPYYYSMRAVTINASADKIWPWLAQIGQDRAGFYSYTWFENLLGAGYRNATRIHPEWQDIRAGSTVWNMPNGWRRGKLAGITGWPVTAAEPGRYFVLKRWGVFYLEPIDPGHSRLLLRGRTGKPSVLAILPLVFIFDPGHFAMEKRMMLEVKRLAEGRSGPPIWISILAWAGFVTAAVISAVMIITRKKKWPWLAVPLAHFLFVLLSTSDIQAALVGFLALSLIIIGFVAFRRQWWRYFMWWWLFTFSVLLFSTDAFVMFGLLFLIQSATIVFLSFRRKSVR